MNLSTPFALLLSASMAIALSASAQTTLSAGDIAFTGYNATDNTVNGGTSNDDFSFVLLRNIAANTTIYFTDFGWRTDAQAFQTAVPCGASTGAVTDGIISWTADTAMPYGTHIVVRCKVAPLTSSHGSVAPVQATYNVGSQYLSLATSGEALFAYQNTFSSPTLIAGISMLQTGSYPSGWATTLNNCDFTSTPSALPTALSTNDYAFTLTMPNSYVNARLLASVDIPGNASAARAVIADRSNWEMSTNAQGAYQIPPTNTVLPVTLISFGVRGSGDAALLTWRVGRESNIGAYIPEHSTDGVHFTAAGRVAPAGLSDYSFTAAQPQQGVNYYRLRIAEMDGTSAFSGTVRLDGAAETAAAATISPNPARDVLTLRAPAAGGTATILSATGVTISRQDVRGTETSIPVADLPAGMYFLRYTGAASVQTFSFVKQ